MTTFYSDESSERFIPNRSHLNAEWLAQCEQLEIAHVDGLSIKRTYDPASGKHWLTRSAALTDTAACDRLQAEIALAPRLASWWALVPQGSIWTQRELICVYAASGTTRLASAQTGEQLSLTAFFEYAAGAARALGEAHSLGLLHGDIRPWNLVIDDGDGVRLFGTHGIGAGQHGVRRDSIGTPRPLEHLHAVFTAPEIALGHIVEDSVQADLYALGVTLYSMLTGVLPLQAESVAGWQHAQVAVAPPEPKRHRADVPDMLGALVLKLMAKDTRERYSSAASVLADLLRCRHAFAARGRIDVFSLDGAALPMASHAPARLFGRANELETLHSAFDVAGGSPTTAVVLVTGAAGAGKSMLVESFIRDLQERHATVAIGQSRQSSQNIPYAPVAQAIRTLAKTVLGESEQDVDARRTDWLARLEGQGRAVIDLVPEVERIIGPCPPLADVSAEQARARTIRALLHTFVAFARRGAPLVLFFDDLQWADDSTLSILAALADDPPEHLMLILAWREESSVPGSEHNARLARVNRQLLEAANGAAAPSNARTPRISVTRVRARNLTEAELISLISAMLDEKPAHIESLARAVHLKTGGNPFFARQLLRALIDDGVLAYDIESAQWAWSDKGVAELRSSENVVELMIRRIGRLPKASTELIALLACIGNRCDTVLLSEVSGIAAESVRERLHPFVDAGLLSGHGDGYAFSHDRVMEAAYSLLPTARRPAQHARIASTMIALCAGEFEFRAFEICGQIERAGTHPVSEEEDVEFVRVLLAAARRASHAAAFGQATLYVEGALKRIKHTWWTKHYSLAFGAHLLSCECSLAQGDLSLAAGKIEALLQRSLPPVDKAAVFRLKAASLTLRSNYEEAISAALAGLAFLDVHLPNAATPADMRVCYQAVSDALRSRPISSIADLPTCNDPKFRVVMGLLSTLSSSFFVSERIAFLHLATMVQLTLENGVTPESPYGLAWFGVFVAHLYDTYEDGVAFALAALALVDRHSYETQRVATLVALDQVSTWTRPLPYALAQVKQARKLGRASGDIGMACYACNHIASDLIAMGENLALVEEEIAEGLQFTSLMQYLDIELILSTQLGFTQFLRGTREAHALANGLQTIDAVQASNSNSTRYFVWLYDGISRVLTQDFDAALKSLKEAEALFWSVPAHINIADCSLFLALAESRGTINSLPETLASIEARRKRFAQWAELNPLTFRNRLLLVDAEIARLSGDAFGALAFYEQSIEAASLAGFIHEKALAHELAGELYAVHGLKSAAERHVQLAFDCYRRWGALFKAQQLDKRYPMAIAARADEETKSKARQQSARRTGELGTTAARAMSSEVMLDRLIETLLSNIVLHAGAQYGVLLLIRDGEPRIEASARVGPQAIDVQLGSRPISDDTLPVIVLNSVLRTREPVVLSDASRDAPSLGLGSHGDDALRSVLCYPLLRGGSLIGVIYLENRLMPDVFDAHRVAELEILAPQVAISLETARLYEQLIDESERRLEAEVGLRAARAELARTSHVMVLGNLAASIAHEVNQPLTGITASVDASMRWLNRPTPNIDEVRTGLNHIKRNSVRAADIIRALRALAKQAPSSFDRLDADALVQDVLATVKLDADAQAVRIVNELGAAGVVVEGDRVQLQQVVLNLVTNALEAMQATPRVNRALVVASRVEENDLVVTVRDFGHGIPDDVVDRLFDPFFTTKSTGMGMGLAICRSVMVAHHGSLEARSLPDGAEFEFRLPVTFQGSSAVTS